MCETRDFSMCLRDAREIFPAISCMYICTIHIINFPSRLPPARTHKKDSFDFEVFCIHLFNFSRLLTFQTPSFHFRETFMWKWICVGEPPMNLSRSFASSPTAALVYYKNYCKSAYLQCNAQRANTYTHKRLMCVCTTWWRRKEGRVAKRKNIFHVYFLSLREIFHSFFRIGGGKKVNAWKNSRCKNALAFLKISPLAPPQFFFLPLSLLLFS